MKMVYEKGRVRPIDKILADLSTSDVDKMAPALFDLMTSLDDYDYLRDVMISFIDNPDAIFAGMAIRYLGDLARLYPENAISDVRDWRKMLREKAAQRNELAGAIEDALDDFDVFLGR